MIKKKNEKEFPLSKIFVRTNLKANVAAATVCTHIYSVTDKYEYNSSEQCALKTFGICMSSLRLNLLVLRVLFHFLIRIKKNNEHSNAL